MRKRNYSPGSTEECHRGTKSSLSDTDDTTDNFKMCRFRTVACQPTEDSIEYPACIKTKNEMEIKDVVKENLLPFLPAKSLTRFRSVSKGWNQWIMSPFLAHKQSHMFRDISGFFCQDNGSKPIFLTLSRSAYGVPDPSLKFLPESIRIRSSCNGLLLCQGYGEISYYICNPVTKKCRLLPPPVYYHGSESALVLAFDPSTLNVAAHYQVICAVTLLDQPVIYFEIFSSELDCWRCSTADCVQLTDSNLKSNGFYIKGIAYWLTSSHQVLAFDQKNEISGVIHLPSESAPDGILAEMHGELCYICARDLCGNLCTFDIYGGMGMSFKCSISVNLEGHCLNAGQCQVVAFLNNNVLIFVVGNILVSYRMSGDTVRVISRGKVNARMRCLPYVNSLVNVTEIAELSGECPLAVS